MCVYVFVYVFARSARVAVSSAHSRKNGPIVRAMADGNGESPPVKGMLFFLSSPFSFKEQECTWIAWRKLEKSPVEVGYVWRLQNLGLQCREGNRGKEFLLRNFFPVVGVFERDWIFWGLGGAAKEKSSVPETAPAVVGTAMNQLLGMKGAALETVWHFNALLWSMPFIFCSCRLVELCLQKPSSAYGTGFHEKLCKSIVLSCQEMCFILKL